MGFGGYLSLAAKFPDFVDYVSAVCEEFRTIHTMTKGAAPYSAGFKVYVLNCWGALRTWMTHQVTHSVWNQRTYSYLGVFEALTGLPFDVRFLSFDDLRERGVPEDAGVLLNAGDAGTAWSGGENWLDKQVVAAVRKFVARGGGFIGVGEPTACLARGAYFQLSDVLGLERERGLTLGIGRHAPIPESGHFICRDLSGTVDYGEGMDGVYAVDRSAHVLDQRNRSCTLAVHSYGDGRSVYLSGLPYNQENRRLLLRTVFWAASREAEMETWFAENPAAECFAYPAAGTFAVVNSTEEPQHTLVRKSGGESVELDLEPMECRWLSI